MPTNLLRLSDAAIVVARHSSGKWLRADTHAFDVNVKEMRKGKCSIVTRTEGADPEAKKSINIPGDGWGVWQPHNQIGDGLTDCSIEWDQDMWYMKDAGIYVLTSTRIRTEKGFLLPPSQMPWVLLEPKDPAFQQKWRFKEMLVSSAHNNLQNTATRARAWRIEGDNFTQFQIKHKARGRLRYHCGDINQDFRSRRDRSLVYNNYLRGTGLHNGWSVRKLPAMGTHGRAILDQPFSNARMRTILLPDDISSDHRPLETTLI